MAANTTSTSTKSILALGSVSSLVESLFPGGTSLPSVAFLLYLTPYLFQAVGSAAKSQFISSVEIKAHDEIFNYVMSWVARHKLSRNNHRLLASSTLDHEPFSLIPSPSNQGDGDGDDVDDVDPTASLDELRSKISLYNARPLHWTPSVGTHFFMYENRLISFTRSVESQESSPFSRRPEKIELSCLGRNADVLKRIIYNARIEYLEKQRGRTSIYRAVKTYGDELSWTKCMSKPTRPMSTIALDETIKQSLIKDLSRYLNPRTKNWYATRGIPYRRGYLFSGPPGTGKTSLTLAAAGLMGLNIYMISLSSPNLSEDSLATMLEDIDAAGLTNKRKKQETQANNGPPKPVREPISLSGLLNVIDGVGAQEGRVLVMTSNHTENIDPALLRPGRVDFSVEFGLASSDTITQLFRLMYGTSHDEVGSIEHAATTEASEKSVDTTKSVAALAEEFTMLVPSLVFSPAAIQGYLLMHEDPIGAVDAAGKWVEEQQRLMEKAKDDVIEVEEETKPRTPDSTDEKTIES
ncbi:Putative mitochondrial chaperone BCS1-B [Fusarium oxysporum f. sp. cubense race 1]|uniref:Putative mitochondrial chaperone BCS1-B n=1 Tax=Fusarium oxysporum f. sp. cubense (strain race 1) TaxID=1229664 RepID=N4U511_FUSC1|nr:Putative mitochondrial chaperone BCS1-B [Fusarium oxysporum f. sp. cubense race 1]